MVDVLWLDATEDTAVLRKVNGETILITVGTLLRYKGRPDGVKITGFSSKTSDKRGPLGLYYLPWRPADGCWAEEVWTIAGNTRHIIAYPVGTPHYGEHIDWNTVELLSGSEILQIQLLLLKP